MIENDFDEKDTVEERIEKLSRQTGLDFRLKLWPQNPRRPRLRHYSLSYVFAGQQRGTGPMRPHEMMHWTATFALGFRMGVADVVGLEPTPAGHFTTALQVIEHCGLTARVGRGRKLHAVRDGAASSTFCGREGARPASPGAGGAPTEGCKVCAFSLIGDPHGPWDATYDSEFLKELGLAGSS